MEIKSNYNLINLNTFKLESIARYYCELDSIVDLPELADFAKKNSVPIKFLGGGSNLVLPPKLDALVIKNNLLGVKTTQETDDATFVKCASGENWHQFVMSSLKNGHFGLENLALIPGTVGGAPIQNIGAYGVEVNHFISQVYAYDLEKKSSIQFSPEDCQFSYRNSVFKSPSLKTIFITDVEFKFPKNHTPNISYAELTLAFSGLQPSALDVANKVIEVRRKKLPDVDVIPNVGSFFKNPIISGEKLKLLKQTTADLISYPQSGNEFKLAAGQLIDKLGYKGKKESTVGMYEKQALVMVNLGRGRIEDVQKLVSKITMDCFNQFGIKLEVEPIFW